MAVTKTTITQIALGDDVLPATANQPHLDLEANIDDLISEVNGLGSGGIGIGFGYNSGTTTGLNFGYDSGIYENRTAITVIAASTILLTLSTTNYVEINTSSGTIVTNTSGYTITNIPLWIVTTDATDVTGQTDNRAPFALRNTLGIADAGTSTALSITSAGDINLEGGSLFIKERATKESPAITTYGQLWVKTATPNELWFTNDADVDFQLGVAPVSASTTTEGISFTASDTHYQEGAASTAARVVTLGNLHGNSILGYRKYCTTDTVVNTSTALTNITGMSIPAESGADYAIEVVLIIDQTSSVAGIKAQIFSNVTSDIAGLWSVDVGAVSETTVIDASQGIMTTTTTSIGVTVLRFKGILTAGGGDHTIDLRFAQNSSVAADLTVRVGSWVELTQMSSPV